MNAFALRYLAVLALIAAPAAAFAKPVLQTLHTVSAQTFSVYVDGPADAKSGIILVHDWFGVSPFYLEATEHLARLGYRVVAVDLYDGARATTHDEAGALLKALDAEVAANKIDAAVQALTRQPRTIAVMGFSMGAGPALEAALRHPAIAATLIWYGPTVNDAERLRNLGGPALLVVGSKDGAAAENAAAFSKATDAAGAAAEIHIYPGDEHAFAQPLFNGGRTYDRAAADAAWRVSEDFLRRRLR